MQTKELVPDVIVVDFKGGSSWSPVAILAAPALAVAVEEDEFFFVLFALLLLFLLLLLALLLMILLLVLVLLRNSMIRCPKDSGRGCGRDRIT
jgi:hypothetical protein